MFLARKARLAFCAREWAFSCMDGQVSIEVGLLRKAQRAMTARIRTFACMCKLVFSETLIPTETGRAVWAGKVAVASVNYHVCFQIVALGEC
jgi:hypothetical protein